MEHVVGLDLDSKEDAEHMVVPRVVQFALVVMADFQRSLLQRCR